MHAAVVGESGRQVGEVGGGPSREGGGNVWEPGDYKRDQLFLVPKLCSQEMEAESCSLQTELYLKLHDEDSMYCRASFAPVILCFLYLFYWFAVVR